MKKVFRMELKWISMSFLPFEHWTAFPKCLLIVLVNIWSSYSWDMFKIWNPIYLMALSLFKSSNRISGLKQLDFISLRQNIIGRSCEVHQGLLRSVFLTIHCFGFRVNSIGFVLHFAVLKLWGSLLFHIYNCLCRLKFLLNHIIVFQFSF